MTFYPGDWFIALDQPSGLFIATLLEPASMWGLSRHAECFSPSLTQESSPSPASVSPPLAKLSAPRGATLRFFR